MSRSGVLATALLVVLARPATWWLALTGFLLRGGLLLVLAPIVVLPSAVGLANVLAPAITQLVFGGATPLVVGLAVAGVASVAIWLVLGGLVAAAVEVATIRLVAADEEVGRPVLAPRRAAPGRILLVRLLAAVPLVVTLTFGSARIIAATYRELTNPSDVGTPLIGRVIDGAPEAVAMIMAGWLVAEVLGGLAARHVVLDGASVGAAMLAAVRDVVRRPLRVAVETLVPALALVAVLLPSAAASSVTWTAVRAALDLDQPPLLVGALVVLLVGLWGGGLVLAGLIAAWRSAVWTVEVAGTFGGATMDPSGGVEPVA